MGMIVTALVALAVPIATWYLEKRDTSRRDEIRALILEARANEKKRQQRNQQRRMHYAGAHFITGR